MCGRRRRRRRDVLRVAGALVGSAGLAGCTDDVLDTTGRTGTRGTVTGSTGAGRGNADLRQELGLSLPDYDYGNTLRIFQWENYWPTRTVREFSDAFGVERVTVDTYTSNEELRTTLEREGLAAYDLVFPSDWMVTNLIESGMLTPLDLSKLPNWTNLADRWTDRAPYDTGSDRYSVPYQWGTTGIGWNSELIGPGGIDSWDAMWNEAWAGQMTMLDNKRETIGAALKRLGYSLNTREESEIEEATETLVQQRDLLRGYDSGNMPSNLADGEASPVHTWNGEAFIACEQLDTEQSPIEYTIPDEGGIVWIDTAAIPRDSPNVNTAHLFVDYFLSGRVNASITNHAKYATPNEAARTYLPDSHLNNELVFPPEEACERLEFIRSVGDAADLYQQAWDEIRNA